jgi:hypothetical protein
MKAAQLPLLDKEFFSLAHSSLPAINRHLVSPARHLQLHMKSLDYKPIQVLKRVLWSLTPHYPSPAADEPVILLRGEPLHGVTRAAGDYAEAVAPFTPIPLSPVLLYFLTAEVERRGSRGPRTASVTASP